MDEDGERDNRRHRVDYNKVPPVKIKSSSFPSKLFTRKLIMNLINFT